MMETHTRSTHDSQKGNQADTGERAPPCLAIVTTTMDWWRISLRPFIEKRPSTDNRRGSAPT